MFRNPVLFHQSLTVTLITTGCSLNFARIDSGFNDVKDPDELFAFKNMVKHFIKKQGTGQMKEVWTKKYLKLGKLFRPFSVLLTSVFRSSTKKPASTHNMA